MDWLAMAVRPRTPRPELRAAVLARAYAAGRRRTWWPLAAAAALVVTLAAAGYGQWRVAALRAERDRLAARAVALRDTLDFVRRPGTSVLHIPVVTAGKAGSITIFTDAQSHRWLVTCNGLTPNTAEEVYQIWFVTAGGVRSALVMPMPDANPRIAAIGMPDAAVTGVMMTVEPDSGSTEPRGPVVFEQAL